VRSTKIPTESCLNSCGKCCGDCSLVGLVREEVTVARAGFVTSLTPTSETAFVPNGVLLLLGDNCDSGCIAKIEFRSLLGESGTRVEEKSMRPEVKRWAWAEGRVKRGLCGESAWHAKGEVDTLGFGDIPRTVLPVFYFYLTQVLKLHFETR